MWGSGYVTAALANEAARRAENAGGVTMDVLPVCGVQIPHTGIARTCSGRMQRHPEYDWIGPDGYEWHVYKCNHSGCERVAYNVCEADSESGGDGTAGSEPLDGDDTRGAVNA